MSKKSNCGLILLFPLLLVGCSKPEHQVLIPPQLLIPCNEPQWNGETNGDLVEYVGELREALGRCNADKAAISELVK